MKRHAAELLTRDPERFFHHDRVFLNNPVVMQGMGLAPLVVLATSGQNALMLAVAVALLLTPSRMSIRPTQSWKRSCCPAASSIRAARQWSIWRHTPS